MVQTTSSINLCQMFVVIFEIMLCMFHDSFCLVIFFNLSVAKWRMELDMKEIPLNSCTAAFYFLVIRVNFI